MSLADERHTEWNSHDERELGAFERGFLLAVLLLEDGAKYTTAEICELLGYRWNGTAWNTLRRLRPNGYVVDLDEDGFWTLNVDRNRKRD